LGIVRQVPTPTCDRNHHRGRNHHGATGTENAKPDWLDGTVSKRYFLLLHPLCLCDSVVKGFHPADSVRF
jgi:hypothetical protein